MDLDGIFITCADPNHCAGSNQNPFQYSWGYRENKYTQSTLQHKYIGLSEQLWTGNDVPIYSTFENLIASQLLSPYTPTPPIKVTAVPDSENLTALAALAHEYGHINWWKFDVEYSKCPTMGTLFSSIYWQQPQKKTQKFHRFGIAQGDKALNNVPTEADIFTDLMNQSSKTYAHLLTIYGGAWASLFSAVAPDEDFIETYKLWVLTTASTNPLTSLTTNYSNGSDIVANYLTTNTPLNSKYQWITQCFAWP
jgi:hypothetical protein